VQLKDYYTILELPASATTDEIKKAYRRLAHQYHPDKKGNDPYAAAQFAIIKEAYETLTNPVKKDHYLQQRWYAQSMGKRTTQGILTPVTILQQWLELEKYTSRIDEHRLDEEGLYEYINQLLSGEHIQKLNEFGETDINKQVISLALSSSRLLSYGFIPGITERLKKINVKDESVAAAIAQFTRQKRQTHYWEKQKIWIVLLVLLLLCLGIFFAA
jgi:molecular chaperone DnaJ